VRFVIAKGKIMSRKKYPTLCLFCALNARQFASGTPVIVQDTVSPAEARAIAKEAYIFGFPLVDGYRIQLPTSWTATTPSSKRRGTRSGTSPASSRPMTK
jgi:hypothetical protein